MRQLSTFEQQLMRRMKEGQGNNLPNLIDPFLEGIRIIFNRQESHVEILAESTQPQPEDDEVQQILDRINTTSEIVVSAVNLLNLLEREGYIIIYTAANQIDNQVTFGQGAVNLPSVSYEFPDERISELLIKYSTQEIVFTPEADEYVERNFITRDEQRHRENISLTKKSISIAWVGVAIAVISSTVGIGFDIYDHNKPKNTTQIDKIKNIDSDLDKTNKYLENIIELQNKEIDILENQKSADTSSNDKKGEN
jgi:hypothetical protein